MKTTFKVISIHELIQLTISGKLNPDPISQRPATSPGPVKSQEIVAAIMHGFGVGMITVRDISEDSEMQKIYPGVHYLVIDGGHRVRGEVEFYTNKITYNGKYFKELSEEEQQKFLNHKFSFESIVCTSQEAIHIFRTRNKTTKVNFIEMIMCDDQSAICREVRSRTKFYPEYNNDPHPLFDSYMNTKKHQWVSTHFDGDVNPRRKWDEYVFIAMLKAIGGGNVDAGQQEIEGLVAKEYEGRNLVTKRVLSVVDRFFDDVLMFNKVRSSSYRNLNGHIMNALQIVWFDLYEKNPEFKIHDMKKFQQTFMYSYSKLTGKDSTLNNKIVEIDGEAVNLKEYIRGQTKNYSNSKIQRNCAKYLIEYMGGYDRIGVTFRDSKRSITTKDREEQLALQGYKCAITGLPLTLEDSVWGHDVAWADGGKTAEGKVIDKNINTQMGKMSVIEYKKGVDITDEEYKMILALRNKNAA